MSCYCGWMAVVPEVHCISTSSSNNKNRKGSHAPPSRLDRIRWRALFAFQKNRSYHSLSYSLQKVFRIERFIYGRSAASIDEQLGLLFRVICRHENYAERPPPPTPSFPFLNCKCRISAVVPIVVSVGAGWKRRRVEFPVAQTGG